MIQTANSQRGERSDNIGANVHRVEVSVIGEKALQDLRAEAKSERYDKEREVERSTATGVQNPVEGYLYMAVRREK